MAMINCPECGRSISEKAERCPNCGCISKVWISQIICPQCGYRVNNKFTECPNCNTKLKKESVVGVVGFVFAALFMFLELIAFCATVGFHMETKLTVFVLCTSPFALIISFVLSVCGCVEKRANHIFAVIGLILSGISIALIVVLWVSFFSITKRELNKRYISNVRSS